VFNKCGHFDENYSMLADYEWNIRGLVQCKLKSAHIPIPIAKFGLDGISATADKRLKKLKRAQRRQLKKTYFTKMELMLFRLFLKPYIRTLNKTGLTKGKLIYVKLLKTIFRFNFHHKPIEF
jgi:mRNA-degrading endonuclease RelE of RelBE toxin-antitoxin system